MRRGGRSPVRFWWAPPLVAAIFLAACGESSDSSDFSVDEYCSVAAGTQANEGEDAGVEPRNQDLAAFETQLEPARDSAPPELQDDYDVLIAFFDDHDTLDVKQADDSVIDAIQNVQDYIGDNCQDELD